MSTCTLRVSSYQVVIRLHTLVRAGRTIHTLTRRAKKHVRPISTAGVMHSVRCHGGIRMQHWQMITHELVGYMFDSTAFGFATTTLRRLLTQGRVVQKWVSEVVSTFKHGEEITYRAWLGRCRCICSMHARCIGLEVGRNGDRGRTQLI